MLITADHLNSTTMFSPGECGTTWSMPGCSVNENRSLSRA